MQSEVHDVSEVGMQRLMMIREVNDGDHDVDHVIVVNEAILKGQLFHLLIRSTEHFLKIRPVNPVIPS